jgi:hypothetical protein
VRAALTRSNRWLIATLPAWLVFALAWPHEVWHYAAARALGLRVEIGPAVCRYRARADWQRLVVLLAPAAVGIFIPGLWRWAWWAGCLGDFMDTARILRRGTL